MSNFYSKKLVQLGVAVATGAAFLLAVPASPAAAATNRNGVCEPGEFCLYKSIDLEESVSDFGVADIWNYGEKQPSCWEFKGKGKGMGECVKNNALSAWNRTDYPVRVYYNSGYKGTSALILPDWAENLSDSGLARQNASQKFSG